MSAEDREPVEGIILPPTIGDHVTIEAGYQDHTPHVAVEAEKDFGNPGGWSGGARWQWAKDKGHAALVYIGWRPKGDR